MAGAIWADGYPVVDRRRFMLHVHVILGKLTRHVVSFKFYSEDFVMTVTLQAQQ